MGLIFCRLIRNFLSKNLYSDCFAKLCSKSEVKLTMRDHNSYLPNHTVSSAQSRVNFGTHTNESSWNRKHHFILFSKQRDNSRSDWLAGQFAIAILGNKSRSHFDLLANFEDTLENRTSGHTSFKVFNLTTRFVDIERPKVKKNNILEKSEGLNPMMPELGEGRSSPPISTGTPKFFLLLASLKPRVEPVANQIYLVTLRPRQLTQASFLQKIKRCKMFF